MPKRSTKELQKKIEEFNKFVSEFVKDTKIHVHIKSNRVEIEKNLHYPHIKAIVTSSEEL